MKPLAEPIDLGPMPLERRMEVIDDRHVHAPLSTIFELASQVEHWPTHLPHYRYVRFRSRRADGGGLVEMSAYRPFQLPGTTARPARLNWPTWWLSEMSIVREKPAIRFRHVGGITRGMEVEWSFRQTSAGTDVRIVHLWNGPEIPVLGELAAIYLIGPVFVHGIAARTLAGLGSVAEHNASSPMKRKEMFR